MARNGRGAASWAKLVEEWKHSGLSLLKFCEQHGLNKGTMSGWAYKTSLRRAIEKARVEDVRAHGPVGTIQSPPAAPSPAFVPVQLREIRDQATTDLPTSRSAIEVIVGAGRRVIVERGFDPETLRQVIVVLESASC